MKLNKTLLILSFLAVFVSCKKEEESVDRTKATEDLGVAYGTHKQQSIDVYLPEGRSDTTKTIILLHGGSWDSGDKDSLSLYADSLRASGFAVVNMNYRLVDSTDASLHPAQVNDIGSVVNLISAKAFEWNVSPDKFGIVGISAGAHLALLYTYAYNKNDKVKTVVSVSGPTNFTDSRLAALPSAEKVLNFVGADFNPANLPLFAQASPLAKVNSFSKPTLLLHGALDEVVPHDQADQLFNKLGLFGIKTEYKLYDNADHDIYKDTAVKKDIEARIKAWLSANIK